MKTVDTKENRKGIAIFTPLIQKHDGVVVKR
jgi:hypothetical protein